MTVMTKKKRKTKVNTRLKGKRRENKKGRSKER